MKIELVASPTIVLNTPIKKSKGDNAEANSFTIHNMGAGQCSRREMGKLMSAAKQPETAART